MSDSKRVRISKREGALMASLSAKEQEVYEVQACARDLYRARRPITDFARRVYTDPAINVEFQLMTAQLGEMENSLRLKEAELKELRASVEKDKKSETKAGDANSAKGNGNDAESKTARASALVSRCQRLEQENEELAASADVAKVAQLTSEKAVAEAYAGELKTALEEAYEYIEQLEEEREVNSNKVYALEKALRSSGLHRQPPEQEALPSHHQDQRGGVPAQSNDVSGQMQQHDSWEESHQQHQHHPQHRHQQQHHSYDQHAMQDDSRGRHTDGGEDREGSSLQQDEHMGFARHEEQEPQQQTNDNNDDDTPALPPGPPPPQADTIGADDTDDLYGDMDATGFGEDTGDVETQEQSQDVGVEAKSEQRVASARPEEGADGQGDPMDEEGREEAREEPEPPATRTRATRRSSRRR